MTNASLLIAFQLPDRPIVNCSQVIQPGFEHPALSPAKTQFELILDHHSAALARGSTLRATSFPFSKGTNVGTQFVYPSYAADANAAIVGTCARGGLQSFRGRRATSMSRKRLTSRSNSSEDSCPLAAPGTSRQ